MAEQAWTNSTQRRATLAELSHVEGTKKGVDVQEERFIDAAQTNEKMWKATTAVFLNEDIYKV